MKSLRNFVGVVLAFALAGVALPAQAQKQYTLDMLPQVVASGPNVKLTATFTNTSPQGGANSSFNALKLVSPYTITKVLSVSRPEAVVTPAIGTAASTTVIKVESMTSVGKGQKVTIEFEATVPETCVASRWNPSSTGDVWSGSQIGSGQTFTLQFPPSTPTTTTAFNTSSSIEFAQVPTSIAVNVPFNLSVKQTNSCQFSSFATVELTGPAGFVAGTRTVTTTSTTQTTTFAGNKTTSNASPQVLTATAGSQSKQLSLDVYANGGLACDTSTTPDPATVAPSALFTASVPSNAAPHDSGYAVGVRGPNKSGDCLLVGWTWTNNIKGTSPTTDQLGRVVPVNGVSFVWDLALQPRATFLYTVTWKAEWLDATGVPTTTTDRCVDAACTSRAPVRACLGTALVLASMPNDGGTPTPVYDKACIVREVRATLPPGDGDYCPEATRPSSNSACVQFSTTFIDFDDPVFIR